MRKSALLLATVALLALTGCGTSAADRAAANPAPTGGGAGFPVEVSSCGHTLRFDKAPERILLVTENNASILDALGVLDRVVMRAGAEKVGQGDELRAKLDVIPQLQSAQGESGHDNVATESVLSVRPDLVVASDSSVQREALAAAGVPLYTPHSYCPEGTATQKAHADFGLVEDEVNRMAAIFGAQDRAATVNADIRARVQALPAPSTTSETAAALFVTPGSTTFYAYGTGSMVQPIFEANGLANAYADQTTRVFDASMEDLLRRNPDWIVVLAQDISDEEARNIVLGFHGARELRAVTNDQLVVLPFALTDPPSVLSVDGAIELSKLIAR